MAQGRWLVAIVLMGSGAWPGPVAAVATAPPPLATGDTRFVLPRAPGDEAGFPVSITTARELALVHVASVTVRDPEGAVVPQALARLELDPAAAVALPSGSLLTARLLVRPADLETAGEYTVEVALRAVPADDAGSAAGPPQEIEQRLPFQVTRRAVELTLGPLAVAEARIDPWEGAIETRASLRVSEAQGQGTLGGLERGAIQVVERGLATGARDRTREAPLRIAVGPVAKVAGVDAYDLTLTVSGPARAGLYELPLEIRSKAAASSIPFVLAVAIRHRPLWLGLALVLGVLAGMIVRGIVRKRRGSEERAAALDEGRRRLELLVAGTADRPAAQRIEATLEKLAKAGRAAAWGMGLDPSRVVEEAHREAVLALRDLESRRLRAETALVELEMKLLASPSDPPEVEAVLRDLSRRTDELRTRLERGEVEPVEEEVGRLRVEVARSIAEAARRWLVLARDVLEALKQRIAHAPRVQLTEAVRFPLETLAGRVAEASPEHLRETLLAARTATTALTEQAFALGFKPAYRDLAEALTLLGDLAGEGALAAAEAARRELHAALETGDLREPFRAIEALGRLEERVEEVISMLAGDASGSETWKAAREATGQREYARAAEATEAVLRLRARERVVEARRRTRVLEVVRLAPRPPVPRVRIAWDSPPTAGFPVLAKVLWLGLEPPRWSVRWIVEGLPAKCERPNVPTTTLQFAEPGFASVRATVDVEGDAVPLVAQTRLRVLPAPGDEPRRKGRGAAIPWLVAESLAAGALAVGAGYVVLGEGFHGTPRDYALALAFGMLADLLVDRLRALAPGRPSLA